MSVCVRARVCAHVGELLSPSTRLPAHRHFSGRVHVLRESVSGYTSDFDRTCPLCDSAQALKLPLRVSTNSIKAKLETADWINASARVVNNLHGIRFILPERVRLPDVKTMLLTFVSGLVMLLTAKTIADYFCAEMHQTSIMFFAEQPDFSMNDQSGGS